MLNILLLVLKIIGITLLVIIVTVLLLVFMILFIPVRYRGDVKKGTDEQVPLYACARAGWFLHIINACYEYKEGKTELTIRVFGIRLRSREEKELKRKQRENKRRSKKDKSFSMLEYDEKSADFKEKPVDSKGKTHVFVEDHEETSDISEVRQEETNNAEVIPETKSEEVEVIRTDETDKSQENDSIFDRLSGVCGKFISRVRDFAGRVRDSVSRILNKLTGLNEGFDHYYNALFNDPRNREAIKLFIKEFKKLYLAISPRKVRGRIEYGFDDPYYTGMILAGAAMLYPLYGKNLMIIPHFDDMTLDFDLMLRGRIYIFTVVMILLKLYFNKNVKRFIHIMKKENADG